MRRQVMTFLDRWPLALLSEHSSSWRGTAARMGLLRYCAQRRGTRGDAKCHGCGRHSFKSCVTCSGIGTMPKRPFFIFSGGTALFRMETAFDPDSRFAHD